MSLLQGLFARARRGMLHRFHWLLSVFPGFLAVDTFILSQLQQRPSLSLSFVTWSITDQFV